jgi:hypothetical protein
VVLDAPVNGIAHAHKQIVAFAKSTSMKSILIAEDDISFTGQDAFNYFVQNIPPAFDLYLGGVMWRDNEQTQPLHDFSGLTLYIINEQFYDVFLNLPVTIHIDRALAGRGNFHLCCPMVAFQHNGYSDNKLRYCNYDIHKRHFPKFNT